MTTQQHWQDFLAILSEKNLTLPDIHALQETAPSVFATSEYITRFAFRHPEVLLDLFITEDLFKDFEKSDYQKILEKQIESLTEEEALKKALRLFRQREMVRIAWREFAGWSNFSKTSMELSAFADVCIDLCMKKLFDWYCEKFGTPTNKNHETLHPLVIAVGKLGGRELNFSSDVDLIFVFPEPGVISHKDRMITHDQFFIRLGQRFIHVLNNLGTEGFVFRVDMRLRPFGSSGPLAISLPALTEYYQHQGRDWERYALIKARVISGQRTMKQQLQRIISSFVYRPYHDYGSIDALRELKETFNREVKLKKLEENIKQGPGGIREIEFTVQIPQLIHGGNNVALQKKNLLATLSTLSKQNLMEKLLARQLRESYIFLRNTENRLQMFNDQQTHDLPTSESHKMRLAHTMGFENWNAFYDELNEHRKFVHILFTNETAEPDIGNMEQDPDVKLFDLVALWRGKAPPQQSEFMFKKLGFSDTQEVTRLLTLLRQNASKHVVSTYAKRRLSQLGPRILYLAGKTKDPIITLTRIIGLLETIMRHSTYLVLLLEKPAALKRLVKLCAASPWIAIQLSSMPSLLHELRDSRSLYAPLDIDTLRNELFTHRKMGDIDNLETQMYYLRRFKAAQILRVSAADITGKLPLMKVSDHLTNTASAILAEVQQIAWYHTIERYGSPPHEMLDQIYENFSIIGYGKLGGIELGYGSDLDLVFLFDDTLSFTTLSENPIQSAEFYYRLAQLIIHILSNIQTATGVLYTVDTRLRPSGNAGLLVNTLPSFREYQMSQAWTWEHQAIVRARPITGGATIIKKFNDIRSEALSRPRDQHELKNQIHEMQERMRQSIKPAPKGEFNLKQGAGGIADIEFIAQYGVLLWGHRSHHIFTFTDTIRILESFASAGFIKDEDCILLCDAYRSYRQELHHLVLQNKPEFIPEDKYTYYREKVIEFWNCL